MAEIDENIVATKRDISKQMKGAGRKSLIVCLERDLAVHKTRRTELAGLVALIKEAWDEIAGGDASWYDSLVACVRDLDNLLLER